MKCLIHRETHKVRDKDRTEAVGMFCVSDLRNVGEAMSGYLEPGCLRPDWLVELEVGLDLGEVDSPVAASWSDTATFSLSVWLMVMGLERSELIFPSLRLAPACVAAPPADLPLTFESMLLELERCPLRPAATPLEDLAGLGKERYCRVTLEALQLSRMPSSCGCEPSRLVLRTPPMPVPLPRAAEDLGALPRVAEPLVSVAPLEVIRAPVGPGIFLYPKEAVVGGRAMPEGGFLPSSPLLFPASEGERWMPAELLEGALPFSEALASSVLPVNLHKHFLAQIQKHYPQQIVGQELLFITYGAMKQKKSNECTFWPTASCTENQYLSPIKLLNLLSGLNI